MFHLMICSGLAPPASSAARRLTKICSICAPTLPHGRGIGKGNRGMSDNEAKAEPATNARASFGPAAGPLVVSETNPRYFTLATSDVAHRRAVYLTGSHVNNNFHDGSGPGADC